VTRGDPEARRIEELLLNATQPVQQLQYDGWLLRLAPNDVKRASSVNPIYGSTLPLEEKIAHCEHIYAEHSLPPLFRLTPFAQPASLEETLAAHGYEWFERSVSMTAALGASSPETRSDLRFERSHLDGWTEVAAEIRGLTPTRREAERARLFESTLPDFAVVAYDGGEVVGCGLMMIDDDYAGLFDIETVETRRREGIGLALCAYLLRLARQNGAERAWLSVVADNATALRLYEKLGFAPVYDYWYRIKP
jgi:ribosomal protein S18 acetylase RimI-like enzyme